jgi:hypothetical protein
VATPRSGCPVGTVPSRTRDSVFACRAFRRRSGDLPRSMVTPPGWNGALVGIHTMAPLVPAEVEQPGESSEGSDVARDNLLPRSGEEDERDG